MAPDVGVGGEPVAAAEGPVLIGVDVGTSSVRAIAFDMRGRRVAAEARPTPIRLTETGGEYDPEAIYTAVIQNLIGVGRALNGRPVAGIAVTSIGESCILIDASGRALAPSIVWHDRRTAEEVPAIEAALGRERVFALSGHAAEPIFTLAKLIWMRRHWPEAMAKARHVLMMADWIAFRLSGVAATDAMLASRTLYFDIRRRRWSEELLALAGVTADFPAPLAASGTPLGPDAPRRARRNRACRRAGRRRRRPRSHCRRACDRARRARRRDQQHRHCRGASRCNARASPGSGAFPSRLHPGSDRDRPQALLCRRLDHERRRRHRMAARSRRRHPAGEADCGSVRRPAGKPRHRLPSAFRERAAAAPRLERARRLSRADTESDAGGALPRSARGRGAPVAPDARRHDHACRGRSGGDDPPDRRRREEPALHVDQGERLRAPARGHRRTGGDGARGSAPRRRRGRRLQVA